MRKINIPPITSIGNALSVYHHHLELGNDEIKKLFGERSPTTISKLKKFVKDEMILQKIKSFQANTVNTEIAYQVWGLDISDLERRFKKINELGLSS